MASLFILNLVLTRHLVEFEVYLNKNLNCFLFQTRSWVVDYQLFKICNEFMHHSMLPLFISCTITKFSVASSLALNNWGQKYSQTLGKKPNPCKGQWPVATAEGNNVHAVCCENNYFPKGNFKWYNSLFHSECTLFFDCVCILLPICLCLIYGTYV